MSPTGGGGDGRHRAFVEHDVDVLFFIKSEKDRGASFDEVTALLESLKASDYSDLPRAPETLNTASVAMVPAAAASVQQSALLYQVSFLEREVEQLRKGANADKERLITLTDQLASLRTELELWRAGRLKHDA